MNFKDENNLLLNSFWDRVFFKKNNSDKVTFELFLGTQCDLACKYCYLKNYGEKLYPNYLQNPERILKNLDVFLNWLIKNKNGGYDLSLFGGELFAQKLGFDCLDLIFNKFKKIKSKPEHLTIPSNYTFLLYSEKTRKIEEIIKKFKKINITIILSSSIDGKYCEENRPFKNNLDMRNDSYYEKVFLFNKKHKFGFHPMIYSESIFNWKKNFIWFIDNFKKYDIPIYDLYLLEVKDSSWNSSRINKFAEFISFLITKTFKDLFQEDSKSFLDFLFEGKGYNILSKLLVSPSKDEKGIPCAIQQNFCIRLGDLTVAPCHRTFYDFFILAKFIVDKGKIKRIEAKNAELAIAIATASIKSSPICQSCPIKFLCSGGCLGSQFEVTGDLFSPIPNVCQLEHAKLYAMIKTYKELGIYNDIYLRVDENKKKSLNILDKM